MTLLLIPEGVTVTADHCTTVMGWQLVLGVPSAEAEKLLEKGMSTRVEIMRTGESSSGAKRWRAIFTIKEQCPDF